MLCGPRKAPLHIVSHFMRFQRSLTTFLPDHTVVSVDESGRDECSYQGATALQSVARQE